MQNASKCFTQEWHFNRCFCLEQTRLSPKTKGPKFPKIEQIQVLIDNATKVVLNFGNNTELSAKPTSAVKQICLTKN